MAQLKCPRHPSYKGAKEPTGTCKVCHAIYANQYPLRQARLEHERREHLLKLERSLREAIGQIKGFEKHVDAIKLLKESNETYPIKAAEKPEKSEATALVSATDWHFGSRFRREQVNGLNEFDVAIAKSRIATFFERVVKLVRKERQDVLITNLVLFLGGDLINGSLHKDTDQSDEIAQPIAQAVECQALIESGINFILNNAGIKEENLIIPCCDGN